MESKPSAGVEAHYLAALNAGRFLIQRCEACARHVFYPRQVCPHCSSTTLAWVEPSGTGSVYSTTTVRRKPEAGGDYDVSLIDLDEGVRMMSRVQGLPPHEVKIGMRVKAKLVESKTGHTVVFEPAGDSR
jgi:uncharacterized protein